MGSPDPLRHPGPLLESLYAYVAYAIGHGPEAEDVTSETLERALRYRASYDPRKGTPGAWLIGIARRCLAESRSRQARALAAAAQNGAGRPHEATGQDVEREALERASLATALAQLRERDRELIALRYGADLTARQIGELLDVKTNTIEVALRRALARLTTTLAPEPSADSGPVDGQDPALSVGR